MTKEELAKSNELLSELLNLLQEGESIDADEIDALQYKIWTAEKHIFWSETYPSYDREARIGHWYSFLYDKLREYNQFPISTDIPPSVVFPEGNYMYMKNREPDIDSMLPALSKRLGCPLN